MTPSTSTPSFTLQSPAGRLVAGYHLAARLANCELVRRAETIGSEMSRWTGRIVWADDFWVYHHTFSIIFELQGAEWMWRGATIEQRHGADVAGVVFGDPDVQRIP
jgi:hypothetical protein